VLTFIIRRIALSIPVLVLASLLVFVFVRATTDPLSRVAQVRDPNARTRVALAAGLQQQPCKSFHIELSDGPHDVLRCKKVPILTQYARYMKQVAHGKLGRSQVSGRNVSSELKDAFRNTIQLIFWGVLISAIIAIATGVYSAVRQYSLLDYGLTGLSFVGLAMPPFWFGLVAIEFGSVYLRNQFGLHDPLFYSIGLHRNPGFLDYVRHLVLPVATLCVQIIASWSRFQRSSMLDVMSGDYIRTATAKGLRRSKVIFKHALRNALIPLVTVMAIDIGGLFGGLIITETIFAIPGMGRLFFTSLQNGDTTVLLPWLMVSAIFIVLFNLLADVLYGVLDPRIRVA
jgi:peptide/nickel transport system permease protein